MKENLQIDKLDRKILSIITRNARVPYLEVARECNVSGAAIHQRINRLFNKGILKGSEFKIDPEKLGYKTCAYIGVFLDHASLCDKVVEKIKEIPEITQCHYTTGIYSLFIKVYTHDNDHLKTILSDRLQKINGISRTETFISLEENLNRPIPV
ncbi:MAG: Lrp/AsnC ligand binding domain-containing protein [Bacteroidetes bacterium]|nr:Lrp/AsnC ligand binding domain-containing protein [Bacteroidota bacterium]